MIITCVSECTKAAFPRTQRVLSKYLPQIGRRTWQGTLSNEGLADMIEELKSDLQTRRKKTRLGKNASIAIYRNMGYSETRLIKIVGNQYAFSAEGRYCFSVRQVGETVHTPLSQWNQLLRVCVRLTGLLHDLGKATVGFQIKLDKQSRESDPIRHEVISWALLAPLLSRQSEEGEREEDYWLKAWQMPEKISDYFSEQATQISENLALRNLKPIHNYGCRSAPLLYGIGWLMLSHHRLPPPLKENDFFTLKNPSSGFGPNLWQNDVSLEDNEVLPFLTIDTESPGLPWKQKAWLDAVVGCVERIAVLKRRSTVDAASLLPGFNLVKDNPPEAQFWFSALYHHLRPVLVSADYLGSADKRLYEQDLKNAGSPRALTEDQQMFANKIDNQWADTLTEHLLKVSRWSHKLFNQLAQWQTQFPEWQTLDGYELPKRLSCERLETNLAEGVASRIHGDKRYRWQQELKQLLVAERVKRQKQRPEAHLVSFGVMVAETGSGKTIGAITALTAATGYARVTTALGYRSLTRQTANSYRNQDEVGFKRQHVAALIGTSVEKEREQQSKAELENLSQPIDGSENSIDQLTEFSWDLAEPLVGDVHPLCLLGGASLRPMLETPVIVATTDHLAHALEGSRGAQLLPVYRIATSDTLFDELDSYRAEDLVSLGRWAYACGYYGRSLWLVSATLPLATVKMFAEQYYSGLRAFELREGKPVQITNGLAANRGEQQAFTLAPTDFEQFNQYYLNNFLKPLTNDIVKSAADFPRHRLCFLPPSEPMLPELIKQIERFHQQFAVEVAFEGRQKRISIGAVMFDSVNQTQRYARLLSAQLPDYAAIVCYHARFTQLDRLLLEAALEPLLNRKRNECWQQALIDNVDIAERLRHNDQLAIVVCTTNILETGRDFDFDWACADLLSVRSLVQLVGRVKRHRWQKTDEANVALFNAPGSYARKLMRYYEPELLKKERPLQEIKKTLLDLNNQPRLGEIFSDQILHSAPLLLPQEYSERSPYLAYHEREQQVILNQLGNLLNRPGRWLNHYLATEFRFRKSGRNQIIVAYDQEHPVWENGEYQPGDYWYVLDFLRLNFNVQICNSNNRKFLNVKSAQLKNGLISRKSRQQLWDKLNDELNLNALPQPLLHHVSLSYGAESPKLAYSSDLGIYESD